MGISRHHLLDVFLCAALRAEIRCAAVYGHLERLTWHAHQLVDTIPDDQEMCQRIECLSESLIESIHSQRDLTFAEAAELLPQQAPVRVGQLPYELRSLYQGPLVADGHFIGLLHTCGV